MASHWVLEWCIRMDYILFINPCVTALLFLTDASFKVIIQSVTMVTGADRPTGWMLAVVRTAAIVVLTAVHDLHLDSCHKSMMRKV